MENQIAGVQGSEMSLPEKKEMGLPILALMLGFIPFFSFFIAFFLRMSSGLLLFSLIFPILGIIIGIVSLCKGKKRIGMAGVVVSIIAIVLPIGFVAVTIIIIAASISSGISGM